MAESVYGHIDEFNPNHEEWIYCIAGKFGEH